MKIFKQYSHVYVEEKVWDLEETLQLKQKFKSSKFIKIDSYKEIFNRNRQDWREQKLSQKLILAHRKQAFLYPCSDIAPSFEHKNFYYTTPAINCMYDCSYCYLQGLYNSAYAVCFLNHQDFFTAVEDKLTELGSMYLCISYDTDLLAFENIVPYCRHWIEFARKHPNLTIEARSKSGNFSSISDLTPIDNVILAWTLSPESIIEKYEQKTPLLKARVAAVKQAIEKGWKVRLCFDPLIWDPSSDNPYPEFLQNLQRKINFRELYDLYFGVFRMNEEHLKRIQRQRSDSDVLYQIFSKTDNVVSYDPSVCSSLKESVEKSLLGSGLPSERIYYHDVS